MKFYAGGPLFYRLQQVKRFSEEDARFYISEIALGLGYLHSKDILYRDMKPENILIDEDGHSIITDFGLSKLGIDSTASTSTICGKFNFKFQGTPEYVAPEVLKSEQYGRTIDWWSLGTLLYEMMAGIVRQYIIS